MIVTVYPLNKMDKNPYEELLELDAHAEAVLWTSLVRVSMMMGPMLRVSSIGPNCEGNRK